MLKVKKVNYYYSGVNNGWVCYCRHPETQKIFSACGKKLDMARFRLSKLVKENGARIAADTEQEEIPCWKARAMEAGARAFKNKGVGSRYGKVQED